MLEKLSKFMALKKKRNYQGEITDPTPMAPPVGYKKQPSIWEQQRALIRSELSRRAEEHGLETFEEADDFEVGDDFDPSTPYEETFEPDVPTPPKVAPAAPPPQPVHAAPTAPPPAPAVPPGPPKAP